MGDVQPYPDMVCGPTCPGHLKMKPSPSQVINRASLVVCVCLVVQACPTLYDPMDCSLPGSSVHGDSPGNNTGVSSHSLLQGIFPTQRSNLGLPHCRWNFNHLNHQGSPPQPGHKVLSSVGCNASLVTTAGVINPEYTQNLSSYPSSLQT